MSQTAKTVLAFVAILIGLVLVYKVVTTIVSTILALLIPIAILGGVGYVVYALVWKNNSLTGGRRFLP
jgi:hypothetical protein